MIDISDLNKAEVLAALYNASKQQGMGFLHQRGQQPLSEEEAEELLKQTTYFDYLHGRIMKVNLRDSRFDPRLYDRDNGEGAAQRVIDQLRTKA